MRLTAMLLMLIVTAVAQEVPAHHHVVLFTAVAGAMALDAYSTQRFLSPRIENKYGGQIYEVNPIARPFVKHGWPGQMLISSIGFGSTLAASRFLHLTNHHRLEVIVPVIIGSISFGLGVYNIRRWR